MYDYIFSYLHPYEILNFTATCKILNAVGENNNSWKLLFAKYFKTMRLLPGHLADPCIAEALNLGEWCAYWANPFRSDTNKCFFG